jgi:hypothetical protein
MFRSSVVVTALLLVPACGDDGQGSGSGTATTAATSATTATTQTTMTTGASATTQTSQSGSSGGGPEGSGGETTGTSGPDPTTSLGSSSTTTTTSPFDTDGGSTGWFGTTGGGDMCKASIDIVFVMDVSTSMAWILQKLANEILVVHEAIVALELQTEVHYGLVVFVDDATIINNGAPYTDVNQLQADFVEWSNFTQSNSQTSGQGFNGDWPENTLDALYSAAYAFQWRPVESTLRIVIHTTDDTFGDKGANQSGVVVQHGYDETVTGLQEREIRVFAFADNSNTGGPGNNEDVSMGFFTPYAGKTPIPEATDGGAFNIVEVNEGKVSLSAAINQSVEESLCMIYIPQ